MTMELMQLTVAKELSATEIPMPRYRDRGDILVRVFPRNGRYSWEREFEILDYDSNSALFWLNEGIGIDYWLQHGGPSFPPGEGVFVVKNVYGHYFRGTWGYDDDDEEWYFSRIRCATPREIKTETLR